jgi:hypothetical protein
MTAHWSRRPVQRAGSIKSIVSNNPRSSDPRLDDAVLQPARYEKNRATGSAGNRMKFVRQSCKYWVALNANELAWTALIIGGVLCTSWLMSG